MEAPKALADATPTAHGLSAYAGDYDSPLYKRLAITSTKDELDISICGQAAWLTPWSTDTFLLPFPNPYVALGLLSFRFTEGASQASAIAGSSVPRTLTISYGQGSIGRSEEQRSRWLHAGNPGRIERALSRCALWPALCPAIIQ